MNPDKMKSLSSSLMSEDHATLLDVLKYLFKRPEKFVEAKTLEYICFFLRSSYIKKDYEKVKDVLQHANKDDRRKAIQYIYEIDSFASKFVESNY